MSGIAYKFAFISSAALLMVLLLSGIASAQNYGYSTSYTSSSSATTTVASTTTIPPNAVLLNYSSKGKIIKVAKGANIVINLNSTYWSFNGSSNTTVAAQVGNTTYEPIMSRIPGLGEGNATATFKVMATGSTNITASRNSCGEALQCTGSNGMFYVNIVVFANLQSSSSTSTTAITTTGPSTTVCIHSAGSICTNSTTTATTSICPPNADCAPLTTTVSSSTCPAFYWYNSTAQECQPQTISPACPPNYPNSPYYYTCSGASVNASVCTSGYTFNSTSSQCILNASANLNVTVTGPNCTTCPTGFNASGDYCRPICKAGEACPQLILLCPKTNSSTVPSSGGNTTSVSTVNSTSATTTIAQSGSNVISNIINAIINFFKSLKL